MTPAPAMPVETALHIPKRRKKTTLWTYFLEGLLAATPVAVVYFVLKLLFTFIMGIVDNALIFLPQGLKAIFSVRLAVQASAFLLLVLSLIVLGVLVKTMMGRFFGRRVDDLLTGIPGVGTIYKATKQVIELLTLDKGELLMTPVLVEWPSPGVWAMAFNTGKVDERILKNQTEEHFTCFVPTTPNPTSGYLVVLPASRINKVDVTVETAVKMVLTGGMAKN